MIEANLYAFTNTNSDMSVSGQFSGTQILSSHGFNFTHESGQSFVKIAPQIDQNASPDEAIAYNVTGNDRYISRRNISLNTSTILPLPSYMNLGAQSDTESQNYLMSHQEGEWFKKWHFIIKSKATL